ncbi:angiotensin-converting enzyme-related protein [Zeugodacus cucurbitae]|uniref:angiotensin-converting enzyme-related protein n=1 Tax=Zeugodacus cucurbitae TaxID=28588 RepID=UPI0023D95B45|nr:angiotensin-converting enzyme-related protein [Zeugodacus cucurbitae]
MKARNIVSIQNVLLLQALFLSTSVRAYSAADSAGSCSSNSLKSDARAFFERENELLRQRRRNEFLTSFAYNTNVTEENRKAMIAVATANAAANKEMTRNVIASGYIDSTDKDIKRQATILGDLGIDVLPESDYKELLNAVSLMQSNYATATVCPYNKEGDCTLQLEPHIQERLSDSRDPKELKYYWRQWYDKAGTPMRENFKKYIELTRKSARLNGYTSYADYWIHFYEDLDFETNLDKVYKAILPLYREIHGYVRYRLRQYYGDGIVSENGNIPMHLLGNMWGQQWDNALPLFTPFPEKPFVDVTSEMQRQNYTVRKLFELGDQFFKSLGMRELPQSFWDLSVLTRPTDREIVCHASAWDFYQDSDVRIKMCTDVNTHYLYVVHHELGHIQYYLQYEHQPTVYRAAPNPGFHEAVGDVIALSVSTPKHLQSIGLSNVGKLDEESRINELFKNALKKIVFLPFAYTMDKYRYAVFRGEVEESKWNCAFWQMRSEFSGVEPPVRRTDADFDPPAKYHIDADVEYLRYFAAHIFQFQFLKAMCTKAGQYVKGDPEKTLDNCDIYNSKEAGEAFCDFLSLGASVHWKKALKEFTGETEMDPAALLEYFEPLSKWLRAENQRLKVPIGWGDTDKVAGDCCPAFST